MTPTLKPAQKPPRKPGRKASPLGGMLVIGLGTLIVPLDTSVNIAFPDITTSFAIPIADIQWVVLAYVLI